MNRVRRATPAVLVASSTLVAEAVVLCFSEGVSPLRGSAILLTIGVGTALIVGSRIAWVVAIAMSFTQMAGPIVFDLPWWVVGTSVVVLVALLLPSSRKFIWKDAGAMRAEFTGAAALHPTNILWLPVRAIGSAQAITRFANSSVISLLACALLPLLVIELLLQAWSESADSVAVEVLFQISFAALTLGIIALVGLLAIAAYRALKYRPG